MRRVFQIFSTVTAGIASYSLVADADLQHTYPATACRIYAVQANDTILDPAGGNANKLRNSNTAGTTSVTCPVDRQHAMGGGVFGWQVDGSGTDWTTVSCNLFFTRNYNQSGGSWPTNSIHTTSPVSGATAVVGGIFVNTYIPIPDFASYAIFCRIPAGATLFQYWVQET